MLDQFISISHNFLIESKLYGNHLFIFRIEDTHGNVFVTFTFNVKVQVQTVPEFKRQTFQVLCPHTLIIHYFLLILLLFDTR